jgi:hypothetical protein
MKIKLKMKRGLTNIWVPQVSENIFMNGTSFKTEIA